jgi:Asp-tRNA(Asn)/Glu-tRNA(Gln) amidotransferase A subunit family amidase
LGIPRAPFSKAFDPEIAKALAVAVEVLRKLTATVGEASLPPAPFAEIFSKVQAAEAYARNTSPFDLLGLPAISVPCGFTTSGLPIGLQIVGAPFVESTVLALAHAYEQATIGTPGIRSLMRISFRCSEFV